MKIPKTVKILGLNWKVIESKAIAEHNNLFGATHNRREIIYIDPDTSDQRKEETFIHEITHALFSNMGLSERFRKENLEEEIVTTISSGLYQVLKDNNLLK